MKRPLHCIQKEDTHTNLILTLEITQTQTPNPNLTNMHFMVRLNRRATIPSMMLCGGHARRSGHCTRLQPMLPAFNSGLMAICGLTWLLVLYSSP